MNAAIFHRGPDSAGSFHGPGVGLAMRRLAIIDLATGDQPVTNEDRSCWIVFNGEIYNFPELRPVLEKAGHAFYTRTDTECILHLYEEYGDECVQHLRGMFAFCLWDERSQRALLARDRLGKKPLYYTIRDGVLYFSSELPSLLKALPFRPSINYQAIDDYLSLQYIPDPLTPFEGIFTLPAAHRLTWQRTGTAGPAELKIERYWQPTYLPKWQASEEELVEELRHRLTEAVKIRLISDVPLGAHLSGGIDSSIVVALMAQLSSRPVKTFSVGFEEQTFSETQYARAVAERYQTEHHEFILTYGSVPQTLEDIVAHLGEPLADPSVIPLYHLSRVTRQSVTVALNGDGGDEAFAGYQRYWLDPWANRYLRLPGFITRRMAPAIARGLPDNFERPVGASIVGGLKRLEQLPQADERASLLRWGSYFSPQWKQRLWRQDLLQILNVNAAQHTLVTQFEAAPAGSFLDRTLFTDVTTYLPGDLLVKADRMTMAHSLEGRSPFLDHELMEWAARLPEHLKISRNRGKVLLRKAFARDLPPSIQGRGKQGFGIPVSAWLRDSMAGWSRDLLLDPRGSTAAWFVPETLSRLLDEHQAGRADHGKRLWALIVLALWAGSTQRG
jgi:asparagine synthase (glutamine-hydrolysing)